MSIVGEELASSPFCFQLCALTDYGLAPLLMKEVRNVIDAMP